MALPAYSGMLNSQTDGASCAGAALRFDKVVARADVGAGDLGHGVQGGHVAGTGAVHLQLGDLQAHFGLAHHGGGAGVPHPGVDLPGVQGIQVDGRAQRVGLDVGAAHELVEGDALDAQVVGGGDLLSGGQVEAGLGFTRCR